MENSSPNRSRIAAVPVKVELSSNDSFRLTMSVFKLWLLQHWSFFDGGLILNFLSVPLSCFAKSTFKSHKFNSVTHFFKGL